MKKFISKHLASVFAGSIILCFVNTSVAAEAVSSEMQAASNSADNLTQVLIKTNMGDITVQLDSGPELTKKNFLNYVAKKSYDDTIFHRVIPGFMIQGGGFDKFMVQKLTDEPIKHEGVLCGKNTEGTIAMARTGDPNSATNQFFINVKDNDFLDYRGDSPQEIGYCSFGHVVSGMKVVKAIEAVPTTTYGPYQDVPVDAVVIESVRVIDPANKNYQ